MGLNKQRGNMYGFVTHTWNTIKGKCLHDCKYCFMKRFKQNKLRFDKNELKTNLGENNFIFVGSSCDMWARNIPAEWILETLKHCNEFNKNKYFFQSKNPGEFFLWDYYMPEKFILCSTIESDIDYPKIMMNSPSIIHRVYAMKELSQSIETMITVEPILKFNFDNFLHILKIINPTQINIGADSGRNNLPEPSSIEIHNLINECRKFSNVYLKNNLMRLYNP